MGMTMITKQELLDAVKESDGIWTIDHDKLSALLARLPGEPERKPYVPAAQYTPGGAAMADTIEELESKLSAIELTLDAHRAALVAAGWLDINGEPVMKHDQR